MPKPNAKPLEDVFHLSFENEEHRRYFDLLTGYGFIFEVAPNLRVGLRFRHTIKGHLVVLEANDELEHGQIYEPKLWVLKRDISVHGTVKQIENLSPEDYDIPLVEEYSAAERDFIYHSENGAEIPEIVKLDGELHIWIKIRPKSMNTMIKR